MSTVHSALFIAAVTASTASFASNDALLRIDMRGSAVAREPHVVLGDLAVIHSSDLTIMRQAVALPMGERPRAGSQTILRREAVERWLHRQLGLPRGSVAWGGAAETAVRAPGQEVDTGGVQRTPYATALDRPRIAPTHAPSVVARGDWVVVRMKSGGVELESRAQALQDGIEGAVVRVRMTGASQELAARVIAAGRVEALL